MHFLNVLNLILILQWKRPGLLNSPIEFCLDNIIETV